VLHKLLLLALQQWLMAAGFDAYGSCFNASQNQIMYNVYTYGRRQKKLDGKNHPAFYRLRDF